MYPPLLSSGIRRIVRGRRPSLDAGHVSSPSPPYTCIIWQIVFVLILSVPFLFSHLACFPYSYPPFFLSPVLLMQVIHLHRLVLTLFTTLSRAAVPNSNMELMPSVVMCRDKMPFEKVWERQTASSLLTLFFSFPSLLYAFPFLPYPFSLLLHYPEFPFQTRSSCQQWLCDGTDRQLPGFERGGRRDKFRDWGDERESDDHQYTCWDRKRMKREKRMNEKDDKKGERGKKHEWIWERSER